MDVKFINPVLKSVFNLFTTMAQLQPTSGTPRMKQGVEAVSGKHVTGLISMEGKTARASVAITFSEPAILHIAGKMLPGEHTEIDAMVMDLAGELSNMVIGGAKGYLESEGYWFQLSLPTIILGSDYLIAHKTDAPVIVIPFSFDEGEFFVEVSYEER